MRAAVLVEVMVSAYLLNCAGPWNVILLPWDPFEHGEYLTTMRDGARLESSRTYNQQLRAVLQR